MSLLESREIITEFMKNLSMVKEMDDRYKIMEEICKNGEVTMAELLGKRRDRPIVDFRHILFYTLRERAGMTIAEIARETGKNHSTVINGINKIKSYSIPYVH